MRDIHLKSWNIAGDRVRLTYTDGAEFFIRKTDFDRAFGCIVNGPKEAIQHDFAIA